MSGGVLNPNLQFKPPSLMDERPTNAPLPPAEQRRLHNLRMKEENDRIRAEDEKVAKEVSYMYICISLY